MIMMDLGLAFDTCEHILLELKLEHIGIRNRALAIMRYFLMNRRCYVEIQGYSCKTRPKGNKSVIQAQSSKVWSTHFILSI